MKAQEAAMWWTSFFVLFCAAPVVLSSSCDDGKYHKCMRKVNSLLESQWRRISINSEDLEDYCEGTDQPCEHCYCTLSNFERVKKFYGAEFMWYPEEITLKNDADCVKDLPDDCEKKYKEVNILKPSIKKFKARFCKSDASEKKLFRDKVSCIIQNDLSFKVCEPKEIRSSFNVTDKKYCKEEMKFIQCFAEKAEKACQKDGRKLWEYMQEPKTDLIKVFCNGAETLTLNLVTMSVLVIATVLRSVF